MEVKSNVVKNSIACYCWNTAWNVRSMNQGKLEVVKQDMAGVNINSLGISELKWTGMGKFNSDNHYIYYCGQESLRRNGVALKVQVYAQPVMLKKLKLNSSMMTSKTF